MLLKSNYRFINFSIIIKLHITEASTVQCTQGCSVNQKVWSPNYVAIAYQICKNHFCIRLNVLEKN